MRFNEKQLAELKRAWEDNGECRSCGWHSAFYEIEDFFDQFDGSEGSAGFWIPCTRKDGEGGNHRGCTIYPNMELFKESA